MKDNEQFNKYLKAARLAREEDNTEDAKKYYDLVKMEDPDCAEAKFFYAYYTMMDGKQGELYNLFTRFSEVVCPAVKATARSEESNEEKFALLKSMLASILPLPLFVNRVLNNLNKGTNGLYSSEIRSAGVKSMVMLYEFGDEVEKNFGENEVMLKEISVEAWKAGVARQQMWYGMGLDKTFPEKYTAKIQKFDSTYVLPKKGGCIQVVK
ncbi:MAG: hypothetical protein IJB34_00155 [Clostridia bacterium]|nr:hypothetical protein [Clostridia bacterium]